MSSVEREEVLRFIREKGYTLGKSKIEKMPLDRKLVACEEVLIKKHKDYKEVEVILEHGVATNGILRDSFNTLFYQGLADSMPPWPWPFKMKTIRGLL